MKRTHSIMETLPDLPLEMWNEIISHIEPANLKVMACLNREFENLTLIYFNCFGKEDWLKRGVDLGKEPPIPLNMRNFDPRKYLLTLVPEMIIDQPLTLSSLDRFVSDCKNGKDTFISNYRFNHENHRVNDNIAKKVKTHWVLLSKEVLTGTRQKKFYAQERLIKEAGFEVPCLIDVIVTIFMHHLKTGKCILRIFDKTGATTFTLVQEKDAIGWPITVGSYSGKYGLIMNAKEDYACEVDGMSCALTTS